MSISQINMCFSNGHIFDVLKMAAKILVQWNFPIFDELLNWENSLAQLDRAS